MSGLTRDQQFACSDCDHPLADHRMAECNSRAEYTMQCQIEGCACALGLDVEPELLARLNELGALAPGTSWQTVEDAVAQARVERASHLARAFYNKILLKTAIRSVIWLMIASGVVYFFPSMTWVWYVVGAFIAIGIALALWSVWMFLRVNRLRPRWR